MAADASAVTRFVVVGDDGQKLTLVPVEEYVRVRNEDFRRRLADAPPVIQQLAAALAEGGESDG